MLDFHTHITKQNSIINIDDLNGLKLIDNYYYSLGNHPWYPKYSISKIEQIILNNANIIAVGECGLDSIKSNFSIIKQIEILKQQINLSEKLKLPLTLHIVKSFNEIIKIKKEINPKQKWIIHGFNNYKQSDILIKNGFYLSYGESILRNEKLQQSLTKTPNNYILLETDDSTIQIEKLYTFVADLKSISVSELTHQINTNFNRITNGKLARKI